MAYRSGSAASLVFVILSVISPVIVLCQEGQIAGIGGDDCLYESQQACTRAEEVGCVWCDLPRRCYSAARSLELGEFCNRKKVKAFVDVTTCDEILDQQRCRSTASCLWCKSEAVDDGCFSEVEGVRLPKHIFTCPLSSSSASTTTTDAGLGR